MGVDHLVCSERAGKRGLSHVLLYNNDGRRALQLCQLKGDERHCRCAKDQHVRIGRMCDMVQTCVQTVGDRIGKNAILERYRGGEPAHLTLIQYELCCEGGGHGLVDAMALHPVFAVIAIIAKAPCKIADAVIRSEIDCCVFPCLQYNAGKFVSLRRGKAGPPQGTFVHGVD